MKKILSISLLSVVAFANCSYKIANLEKELYYAEKYNNVNKKISIQRALQNAKAHCGYYEQNKYNNNFPNYDIYKQQKNALEDAYESKIDAIEDELDILDDMKDNMSKSEYKAKKQALKNRKKQLKNEYKAQKNNLKYGY